MSKRPVNLTLHQQVVEAADELIAKRGYSSLSTLVEELVRNEYEKRFGPIELKEGAPITAESGAIPEHKVRYTRSPSRKTSAHKPLSLDAAAAQLTRQAIQSGDAKAVSSGTHHLSDDEARRLKARKSGSDPSK